MIHNFLFHRVNAQRDKLWDPMSPELFEKCIQYMIYKKALELIKFNSEEEIKKKIHDLLVKTHQIKD